MDNILRSNIFALNKIQMEYSNPKLFRTLKVTDTLDLAGNDLATTIASLQGTNLANGALLAAKQDALANILNVMSINQPLNTASPVVFSKLTIGSGYISAADGGNQFLVSGGSSASKYLVFRPSDTGSLLQYTASSFSVLKSDGIGQSLYINNNTGDVTLDGLTVTRSINGVDATEMAQLANINSVSISNTQWSYLGGMNQNVTQTSAVTFASALLGATTANVASAVRRDYVDGLTYLTAGTGLTKTGSTLSVNASQTQITSVGTLSSLAISGNLTSSTGTFSTLNVSNGGVFLTPGTYNGEIARFGSKAEIGNYHLRIVEENISDHTFCTSGGGSVLRFTNSGISIFLNTTDSSSSTSGSVQVLGGVGIAKNLSVSGAGVFSGTVSSATPTTTGHVTTKAYVDGLTFLTAGTGLTKTSGTLSVNAAQTQITSVGPLTGLTVSGSIVQNISAAPTGTTYVTNSILAGNYGMSVSGGITQSVGGCAKLEINNGGVFAPVLSVDGSTPQLTFKQTANSTSTSSGSVVFLGGVGMQGDLYGVNSVFSGNVSCATPTLAGHASTKAYVDTAITSANSKVAFSVYSTGAFTILGLTLVGLTKEVVYSKVGTLVACTCKFTWTSTTGTLVETDGNCVIGTPYTSLYAPRYVNVLIQKDSFAATKMSFMDVSSAAVQTRVNAADMPGYTTGATLLISFVFYTLP